MLRHLRDAEGVRYLGAEWRDGAIVIEGQDLGPGVERVFGEGLTEYEWAWHVQASAVPALIAALGGTEGDDPLVLLAAWCEANGGRDPGSRLREAGVSVEFWSRVGD